MDLGGNLDVRPSPIAGSWYPGDKTALTAEMQSFFDKIAPLKVDGEIVALVVPHAGHVYSGSTAAHAFKAIEGMQFSRVVILSPSHQFFPQALLTTSHQAYGTPLGAVRVDRQALDHLAELLEPEHIPITPIHADQEHSLEIELPFLQFLMPQGFRLVPLMLREQSQHLVRPLAQALATLIKQFGPAEKTLLVASSDLSHFYPENQANQLDQNVLSAMRAYDVDELYALNRSGEGQACGLGPIAAVMLAARALGANHLTITDYSTSAAVTHDRSSVVGYGSAVITRPLQ